MPVWVHAELAKLILPFSWKGKRDLVARILVTQPPFVGGFSVVDIIVSFVLLCCLLSVFKACVVLFCFPCCCFSSSFMYVRGEVRFLADF